MSNVEISRDGIKFPTWAVALVFSIVMAWMGWMSIVIIDTKEQLVELRAQVKSTAVPEGTEKALQELRNRMNAELASRDAVSKTATENARDITYILREVEALKTRKP